MPSIDREREASLEQMRALIARLLRAQEDERRQIARLLHETTAQDLAALKMLLGRIQRASRATSDDEFDVIDESIELAERSIVGVRALSYQLYPPFLEERGVSSALRWYARGFAGQSGITVTLDLPADVPRLPQEVEAAVYRVVQEALINVHHHAGSATAHVRLRVEDGEVDLRIEDAGRGISPETLERLNSRGAGLGVGIGGMRERLAGLGGALRVESHACGTRVIASIPVQNGSDGAERANSRSR